MSTLKERMKAQREALLARQQEAIDTKDDMGKSSFGSIFLKEEIPEGMEIWRPEKGTHLIDIIPFEAGPQHPKESEGEVSYVVDIWVYTSVGAGGEVFVSQAKNYGEKDPIAEYIRQTTLELSQFNDLRAKRRTVYFVWVHDSPEEEEKGIQLWEVSHFFFELKIDNLNKSNPKGGSIAFSDPFEGMSISFNIDKTGTYKDSRGKDRDSLGYTGHQFVVRDVKEIPDEIMAKVFPLDKCIEMFPDYERVYEAFYGHPYVEGEDAPAPQLRTPPPAADGEPGGDDDGTCPHGHTIGKDSDEHPECGPCVKWDDCHELAMKIKGEEGPAGDDPPPPVEHPDPVTTEESAKPVTTEEVPPVDPSEEKKVSKLKRGDGGAAKKRRRRIT